MKAEEARERAKARALRLLEKRLDGSDNYELVSTDSLAMSAGTYSHPSRKTPFDERSGEFDSGRPKGEY